MALIIKMDSIKTGEHLDKAIPYIVNEDKTKGLVYSNAGVTEEQIRNTFAVTKKRHPSRGNRQAYHFKFSFSKDEKITAEVALSFVKEWAEDYLRGEYDYVCSVHQDRDHMHMHLIFNSVRREGGKYHYCKKDWENIIKPLTNRLSDKYHTGHLKEKDDTLDYSSDYRKKENGIDWMALVRGDIDKCIRMSRSYGEFKRKMVEELHYQLREGVSRDYGLYLSLTPPGKAKAIRSYRLGQGYMPTDIEAKIEGRYVLPDTEEKKHFDESGSPAEKDSHAVTNGLGWMTSRNYAFIPYRELSDYQKAMVRRMLDAKRMYRRTGTSLQVHEQSVRAIKKMAVEMKNMGINCKLSDRQMDYLKRKEKQVQREAKKWRQK